MAAALCGCSVVNDPNDHAAEPVPLLDFCQDYAQVVCDGIEGCCRELAPSAAESCLQDAAVICTSSFGTYLGDPRTGYDPEEAGRALAMGRVLADRCSSDSSFLEWMLGGGALAGLVGTVPAGGRCERASVPMGDPDIARFYSCEDGLACRRMSEGGGETWRCAERVGQGEPCVLFVDCAPGLTCLPDDSMTRVCQPRLAAGMECGDGERCQSLLCVRNPDDATSCESTSGCVCLGPPPVDEPALCRLVGL
ncbi:MAG TPA: hypothetical protein ENK57_15025 [Polyangiaceae bacterium]|nr:hypothetical protein [Polyangiaceae bacterium]